MTIPDHQPGAVRTATLSGGGAGGKRGWPPAHALGFRRGKTPSKSPLPVPFRCLDVSAFDSAPSRRAAAPLPQSPKPHVCLEGKTARGNKGGDGPGQHLVAAHVPAAEAVLA